MNPRSRTTKTHPGKMGPGLSNISPKTMAAVVLMSMMVILWGRVLLRGKGGPDSAEAQVLAKEQAAAEALNTAAAAPAAMQVRPVELAVVAGRHDELTADIFSTSRWTAFDFSQDKKDKPAVVENDSLREENIHRANLDALAGELKLEAVIDGADGMQAFVDGKVLSAGQALSVRKESYVYVLTVEQIDAQQIILKWNTYSIRLKITESQEQ